MERIHRPFRGALNKTASDDVQMTDARDSRAMAVLLRPFDCFVLGLEGGEHVVGVVLKRPTE